MMTYDPNNDYPMDTKCGACGQRRGSHLGLRLRCPYPALTDFTECSAPGATLAAPIFRSVPDASVRQFSSGATRSSDEGKIDYEGFLSFPVLELYGTYMTKHRVQVDGSLRSSSNWKKGIPLVGEGSYIKAFTRHSFELVALAAGYTPARVKRELPTASHRERILDTACAVLFNVQGFLHEALKDADFGDDQKLRQAS
jgi:hypothetical protein